MWRRHQLNVFCPCAKVELFGNFLHKWINSVHQVENELGSFSFSTLFFLDCLAGSIIISGGWLIARDRGKPLVFATNKNSSKISKLISSSELRDLLRGYRLLLLSLSSVLVVVLLAVYFFILCCLNTMVVIPSDHVGSIIGVNLLLHRLIIWIRVSRIRWAAALQDMFRTIKNVPSIWPNCEAASPPMELPSCARPTI